MVVDGLVPSWRKESMFLSVNQSYFIEVVPVV